MNTKDIISLISNIRNSANKFIINEMDKYGIKGLAPSHGDIIFALLKNEKLTMKELTEKIDKDKSTLTALVNKLVRLGYVEKTRDVEDNRNVFVTLTKQGWSLEEIFKKISDELISTTYKNISENEREEVIEILKKIKNNF